MLKQAIISLLSISAILTVIPAQAITPGADKIGACGKFTAKKYGVAGNQITVRINRRTPLGYYLDWQVKPYGSSGNCFVTNDNKTTGWAVKQGPRPEAVALGPNDRFFANLPTYGDVIVNRGQGASSDRQYFLLRPVGTTRNLRWYARCGNNDDQVYDHTGTYVGFNPKFRVLFPYVCEFSPLSPPHGSVKPQPR